MDRTEAEAIVAPLTRSIEQYTFVSADDARALLGDERYERLRTDPIRRQGPKSDTHYPWNVADYVQHPDLRSTQTK